MHMIWNICMCQRAFREDDVLKVQTEESQRRPCLGSRMDLLTPLMDHGSLCTHTWIQQWRVTVLCNNTMPCVRSCWCLWQIASLFDSNVRHWLRIHTPWSKSKECLDGPVCTHISNSSCYWWPTSCTFNFSKEPPMRMFKFSNAVCHNTLPILHDVVVHFTDWWFATSSLLFTPKTNLFRFHRSFFHR